MGAIWPIFVQFVFRVSFGVALSMSITPSRLVTSGYYRVHLWVLMGLNTAAALALYTGRAAFHDELVSWQVVLALAISMAVACYGGAVCWLYEKARAGQAVLIFVAVASAAGALLGTSWAGAITPGRIVAAIADLLSSGLLLGSILAAMFLGHWYLNTPSMQLMPLKRLVILMVIAVLVRSIVCAFMLIVQVNYGEDLAFLIWVFVLMRWLSGLLGTLILGILTWKTLQIPNTQSATGILYAGVILAFIGELTSQLVGVDAWIR